MNMSLNSPCDLLPRPPAPPSRMTNSPLASFAMEAWFRAKKAMHLLVRRMSRDTITIKGTEGSLMIPPFL